MAVTIATRIADRRDEIEKMVARLGPEKSRLSENHVTKLQTEWILPALSAIERWHLHTRLTVSKSNGASAMAVSTARPNQDKIIEKRLQCHRQR